jgi:DNA repair protein RadC
VAALDWTDRLLGEFGTIGGVMAQRRETLTRVTGSSEAADCLKLFSVVARRWLQERAWAGSVLADDRDVLRYLRSEHAFSPVEILRVLFLNTRNVLLRDEMVWEGGLDQAPFWPRSILRRALELDAASLIIVHNHPSGDHCASKADIEATVRLCQAASALDITVHDHLIFSRTGYTSFRKLRLL